VLDLLGIGVGKLEITLDRVDYHLGDTIKGTVTLELTEPLEAKRLVVGVEASQRVVSTGHNSVGYRRDKAWRFEKQLKGEGSFSKLKARFTLKLPEGLEQSGQLPDTLLGDMAQVMSFFTPTKRFPLEWSVFGFLDRPWKINVKAKVPITVSARAAEGKRKRRAAARPGSRRSRTQLG
jgi:hypothetical protein